MTPERMAEILEERGVEQVSVQGNEVWCCCPLPGHDEEKPSFSINVEKGLYNCFVCGGGTLRKLLGSWGLKGEELQTSGPKGLRGRLDVMRQARIESLVHRDLKPPRREHPRSGKLSMTALNFLAGRGFDPRGIMPMARKWDLWSSRGWLHFPVRDCRTHEVVFMVSRSTRAKIYRYSRGAKKAQVLYGAHLLPLYGMEGYVERVDGGPLGVIVVEGVMDALKVWSFGFNAVAILGARPSAYQLELLMKCDEVVWGLDNDVAGMAGASYGFRALRGTAVRQGALYLGKLKDPGEIPDRETFLRLLTLSLPSGQNLAYPGSYGLSKRLRRLRRPEGSCGGESAE